jgi:hypothetical protein
MKYSIFSLVFKKFFFIYAKMHDLTRFFYIFSINIMKSLLKKKGIHFYGPSASP